MLQVFYAGDEVGPRLVGAETCSRVNPVWQRRSDEGWIELSRIRCVEAQTPPILFWSFPLLSVWSGNGGAWQ